MLKGSRRLSVNVSRIFRVEGRNLYRVPVEVGSVVLAPQVPRPKAQVCLVGYRQLLVCFLFKGFFSNVRPFHVKPRGVKGVYSGKDNLQARLYVIYVEVYFMRLSSVLHSGRRLVRTTRLSAQCRRFMCPRHLQYRALRLIENLVPSVGFPGRVCAVYV